MDKSERYTEQHLAQVMLCVITDLLYTGRQKLCRRKFILRKKINIHSTECIVHRWWGMLQVQSRKWVRRGSFTKFRGPKKTEYRPPPTALLSSSQSSSSSDCNVEKKTNEPFAMWWKQWARKHQNILVWNSVARNSGDGEHSECLTCQSLLRKKKSAPYTRGLEMSSHDDSASIFLQVKITEITTSTCWSSWAGLLMA